MSTQITLVHSAYRRAPHITHLANVLAGPMGSQLALTVCGRSLDYFWDDSAVSPKMTDGRTYYRICRDCSTYAGELPDHIKARLQEAAA